MLGYQRWMKTKAPSLPFSNKRFGGSDLLPFVPSHSPLIGSLQLYCMHLLCKHGCVYVCLIYGINMKWFDSSCLYVRANLEFVHLSLILPATFMPFLVIGVSSHERMRSLRLGEIIESHHQSGCWARIHLQSPSSCFHSFVHLGLRSRCSIEGVQGGVLWGTPSAPRFFLLWGTWPASGSPSG